MTSDASPAPAAPPTTLRYQRRFSETAMERRKFGRVNHHSSVVTLGAAGLGRENLPQAEVDQAVELALAAGVNHLDIAPSYGQAMEHMAPWMPRLREEAWFIGAKTGERTRQAAWESIRSCQQRLGVETFNLFQLHAVVDLDDLDQVTQPGGALEALIEMRDQGLTRYIGITGHGPLAPSVQLEALNRFDFDTLMFPLTAALYLNPDYRRDAQALLAAARERNVGVQVIKMLARGGWGDGPRELGCWYDPHREQPQIDQALWWVLSQPVHNAPSTGETTLLPRIFSAANRFRALSPAEQAAAIAAQRPPRPEPRLGIPAAAVL